MKPHLAVILFGLMLMGCVVTIQPKPYQRREIAPLVEQRVEQYNDSSRVIKMEGRGDEIIYTIAVKRGAGKAKDLIQKR